MEKKKPKVPYPFHLDILMEYFMKEKGMKISMGYLIFKDY